MYVCMYVAVWLIHDGQIQADLVSETFPARSRQEDETLYVGTQRKVSDSAYCQAGILGRPEKQSKRVYRVATTTINVVSRTVTSKCFNTNKGPGSDPSFVIFPFPLCGQGARRHIISPLSFSANSFLYYLWVACFSFC